MTAQGPLLKLLKPVTESMAELYPNMCWIALPNKVGYVMHFGRVYDDTKELGMVLSHDHKSIQDISGTKWDTLIGVEHIEISGSPIEELMALKEVQFLAGMK